jgi:hypothetical protein
MVILFDSNGFGAIKLKPASASSSENSGVEVTDFTSYVDSYAFAWTLRYSCSAKCNAINYRGVSTACYYDLLTSTSMGYKLYSLLIASYRRKPKERKA